MATVNRDLAMWRTFAGVSVGECAAITGISVSLIRKEIKAGRLRARRVGERRLVIPVPEVEKLVEVEAIEG